MLTSNVPSRSRNTLLAAAIVLATSAAVSSPAMADNYTWKNGPLAGNAADYGASYPGFTASGGSSEGSTRQVKAAAHLPGGWTLYGSWTSAAQQVCHSYAPNDLGAAILNNNSVQQNVIASFQLNGGGC